MVVGPQGHLATYRKLHLFNDEKSWFAPGGDLPVVELPFGRVGMVICFDLWFPEAARALALAGAEIIAVPTNWVASFRRRVYDDAGYCLGDIVAMATAGQNAVVVACADRVGVERDVRFLGCSVIVGPDGWPIQGPAGPEEETLLVADVDLDDLAGSAPADPAQRPLRRPSARLLQCCGCQPSAASRRGPHSQPILSATTPSTPLLADLNDAQREAVTAPDGPLLIFAGAGSGKTRVLTHRIAYVLATRDVRPHEVCAVTFTNKAAREMRGRIEVLLGGSTSGMWVGTFHALGARILRRDGTAIGIPSSFSIYDEADRAAALRRALRHRGHRRQALSRHQGGASHQRRQERAPRRPRVRGQERR